MSLDKAIKHGKEHRKPYRAAGGLTGRAATTAVAHFAGRIARCSATCRVRRSGMNEEMGKVSDGYHTFDELYDHRCHLFVALTINSGAEAWRSKLHSDGTMFPEWFIAGMNLPTGVITYHLPLWMWSMMDGKGIHTLDTAPEWDGHTSPDVVKRLAAWINGEDI